MILSEGGRDLRQSLQTPRCAGEMAEFLRENERFLEPCAREFQIALVQSCVAQRVEDELGSPCVLRVTVQRQGLLEELSGSGRLAEVHQHVPEVVECLRGPGGVTERPEADDAVLKKGECPGARPCDE